MLALRPWSGNQYKWTTVNSQTSLWRMAREGRICSRSRRPGRQQGGRWRCVHGGAWVYWALLRAPCFVLQLGTASSCCCHSLILSHYSLFVPVSDRRSALALRLAW